MAAMNRLEFVQETLKCGPILEKLNAWATVGKPLGIS
jgi:hypothetical protein